MGGHRRERSCGLLHRQQRLDRFRADAPADVSGRDLAELLDLVRAAVVNLGDVARHARQKYHDGLVPQQAPNGLLDVIDIVRRDSAGTGGGVAGEVDDTAQKLPFLAPRSQHAHLRVDRSGRFEDAGIALAGMRHREAVAHAEPPIEGRLLVRSKPGRAAGLHLPGVGCNHRRDNLGLDAGQIFGMGRYRLVVHQRLDER